MVLLHSEKTGVLMIGGGAVGVNGERWFSERVVALMLYGLKLSITCSLQIVANRIERCYFYGNNENKLKILRK